jgi:hypothetical protein
VGLVPGLRRPGHPGRAHQRGTRTHPGMGQRGGIEVKARGRLSKGPHRQLPICTGSSLAAFAAQRVPLRINRSPHSDYQDLYQQQQCRTQSLRPHHEPTVAAVSYHDPHHGPSDDLRYAAFHRPATHDLTGPGRLVPATRRQWVTGPLRCAIVGGATSTVTGWAARFDRPCSFHDSFHKAPRGKRPDGPSRLGSSELAAGDVSLLASALCLQVTRGRGTPARAGARRPGPASRQVRRSARSGRVIAGRSVQSRSARGRWSSPWRGRRGRRRRRRAGPRRPG